jgi:PPOX class probable F420-dependent enzyme
MIDLNTKFGRQVKRRLAKELTLWFTTVGSDLTPQPRPVWFHWDGESILIFSQPGAHKVRHVKTHPRVAINLYSDDLGHGVVVITGTAAIDSNSPPPHKVPAYFRKYRKAIADLGMSPEEFSREYSVAIRIVPSGLRGE